MTRKNLKVSEIVHEELEVRKRRDESFDDVLKRVLGITPSTVEELTSFYPDELSEDADSFVSWFHDEERYQKFITAQNDHFALNYDAKDSGRTILQLQFSTETPKIEILYRDEFGQLETAGQLIQKEGAVAPTIELEFTHPDTGNHIEFTAESDEYAPEFDDALKSLQNAAYERWG